jgi:thioredoxin 1
MEPTLKRIAEEHPEIDIVMVDVEANLGVTQQLGISSIPTIVYYENGQQIASLAGFQPYDRIKALLGV